jgi:hypothetical protein
MAHVPLKPIGMPRTSVIDDRAFADRREDAGRRSAKLEAMKGEARAGWGDKYVARVHDKVSGSAA